MRIEPGTYKITVKGENRLPKWGIKRARTHQDEVADVEGNKQSKLVQRVGHTYENPRSQDSLRLSAGSGLIRPHGNNLRPRYASAEASPVPKQWDQEPSNELPRGRSRRLRPPPSHSIDCSLGPCDKYCLCDRDGTVHCREPGRSFLLFHCNSNMDKMSTKR
jgi:hypothetical protein